MLRLAKHPVEPSISENHGISFDTLRKNRPVSVSLRAAHFKDVGKVGVELKREHQSNGFETIVADADVLVAAAGQKEL